MFIHHIIMWLISTLYIRAYAKGFLRLSIYILSTWVKKFGDRLTTCIHEKTTEVNITGTQQVLNI